METIFDYDPTDAELKSLFAYDPENRTINPGFTIVPVTLAAYFVISDEEKLLDIAQLLEARGEKDKAAKIWSQIPDLHRQWKNGFDNLNIPTE